MPIIRTSVRAGTPDKTKAAIVQGIHDALVSSIGMPEDELFNLVESYDPQDFYYSRTFNGIARSDAIVLIEITMRRGRSDAMKTQLYQSIAQNIEAATQIDPRDLFIFMHENDHSDWSVGNGKFAMVIAQQRGADG